MAIGVNSDKVVSIVKKDAKEKLTILAERDGRSVSDYVARLIDKDIELNYK